MYLWRCAEATCVMLAQHVEHVVLRVFADIASQCQREQHIQMLANVLACPMLLTTLVCMPITAFVSTPLSPMPCCIACGTAQHVVYL